MLPQGWDGGRDMSDWIQEGLRFKCTECGKCCTGSPGYVWVTLDEMEKIAASLHLTLDEFTRRYVKKVDNRYSLIDNPSNYACIFLKDKRCMIYENRPKQCRTFPWWDDNLSSPESWRACQERCEGINDEAPLITLATIKKLKEC